MRYGSICSGIEAASVAWRPLRWECAFVSEIDPFPAAVLKERFPEVPNLGDFTKISGNEFAGKIDLLVGGSPCQSFSIAGLRKGLKDARGNLTLEFAKLAYRLDARWVVWENVPGVLSSGGGYDFASYLSLLVGWEVRPPTGGWRKSGIISGAPGCFSVGWRVLDAQYTRVPEFRGAIPQRRKRIILVGYLGPWTRPAKVLFDGELCGGDTPPRREKGLQVAGTVREGAQVSGGTRQELTWWDGADAAPTFTTRSIGQTMPDKGQLPCILDRRWLSDSENGGASPTILSTDYKEPKAVITGEPLCYPLDLMNIDGRDKMNYITIHGEEGGSAYPITRRRPSGVCTDANGPIPLVRKLMPVEAERLMGFKDNWTRIPWRGKPAEECPEGHRYKALGNSMCVNVMSWIGHRIDETEKELQNGSDESGRGDGETSPPAEGDRG